MGGLLEKPITTKHTDTGQGVDGRWSYGLSAMQGWRPEMEDAHLALPDFDRDQQTGLFGVFDGHGGSAVAEVVAETLPDLLRGLKSYRKGLYSDALYEAFLKIDVYLDSPEGRAEIAKRTKEVKDDDDSDGLMAESLDSEEEDMAIATGGGEPGGSSAEEWWNSEGPDGMGCTAVVALLKGGPQPKVFVANAGDSRCVLVRKGTAMALSKDHKPTLQNERERIEKAGGFVNNEGRVDGNLNLSRALGDFLYKKDKKIGQTEQKISCEPDVRTFDLGDSDSMLLLGCDGIFEKETNKQIVNFMLRRLQRRSPDKAPTAVALSSSCSAFLNHNLARNPFADERGCDNMSLVLVNLREPGETKPMPAPVQRTIKKKPKHEAFRTLRALGRSPRQPFYKMAKVELWNEFARRRAS